MQVSNPIISSYLSGTINRSQQVERLPVRSNTQTELIEGQLVDDKKKKTDTSNRLELIAATEEALNPQKITTDSTGEITLLQKNFLQEEKQLQSGVLLQNELSSENKPSFPFSHRRSSEGLAGSSLVIQKYLNNEPSALPLADNSKTNVDFFI